MDRDQLVKAVHEIQYIRKMLAAVDGKEKGSDMWTKLVQLPSIKAVRERLHALRHDMKQREQWREKAAEKREKAAIEQIVPDKCLDYPKIKVRVHVGQAAPNGERSWVDYEKPYRSSGYVQPGVINVYVGHMWRKKVYLPLLVNRNFWDTATHFICSAEEYRINVKHIRLYTAVCWHRQTKEMRIGYIGQSKIGKQKAEFHTSKTMAIHHATLLVAKDLDAQLTQGENE